MRSDRVYLVLVVLAASVAMVAVAAGGAGAVSVSLSDRYIALYQGVSGQVDTGGTTGGPAVTGRWAVVSQMGDPETPVDDGREMIFYGATSPAGLFGFFKVRVGNTIYFVGDDTSGAWSAGKAPQAFAAPAPGLGLGRSGGFIDGEWQSTQSNAPVVLVRIRSSIVRDQARFEITLTNPDRTLNPNAASQSIGFEMCGDVSTGNDDLTWSGYPYVPGLGFARSTTNPNRSYGLLFSGASVPDYVETYDDVENPGMVVRNTLRGQDCVAPDHVAFGEWGDLVPMSVWLPDSYKPDPRKPVGDLCWMLCWNPKTLSPGRSYKIVTYYGIAAASTLWTYQVGRTVAQDSVALAVQTPRSLKYDSTTTGQNSLDPSPFDVTAYVYNLDTDPGPFELADVTATLFLPPGLELAPGETAQKQVGLVPISSEALPITWQVQATGEYSGELEAFVSASDTSGWQQVVSRAIMVPATKKSVFRSGWQLMHVPFTFNNGAVDHALGLNPGTFGARYYDPATRQYLPLAQLRPGQAFWMFVQGVTSGKTQPFELASDAAIVGEQFGKQLKEQYISLAADWNLVGNPFVYPVYWGQVQVYNKAANVTVSLDQAVANGWISKTLFEWNPDKQAYDVLRDNQSLLLPWKGYWVRAKSPVKLVFRPAVFPASAVKVLSGGY